MSKRIDRAVRETYALHYLLLNLGILHEEIFVGASAFSNASPPGIYAHVRVVRGEATFDMWLEPLAGKETDRYLKAWSTFSHAQPKMDRAVLDRMVEGSRVLHEADTIADILVAKGFSLGGSLGAN